MPRCEVCGNDYDKTFEIRRNGATHVFDCFECAIHALAPLCQHCGCRVIGHGVEVSGQFGSSAVRIVNVTRPYAAAAVHEFANGPEMVARVIVRSSGGT